MSNEEIAISVKNISKDFLLPHEKHSTIKSAFTNIMQLGKKTIEKQHALKDVNFEVKKGEFFGIVGRNGSGKSTLLKILAGIYQPTSGTVHTVGKLVPFIELGVGFNPELTGRENVYLNGALLGFSKSEVDAMYDDVVAFAEIERFMDQKLKNYSSGMQVRLAFSLAIRAEADILLIDEVLAVGDEAFQRKCFEYFRQLKKNRKTIIFVSHDMNSVRQFCDRAAFIEKNELIMLGTAGKIADAYTKLFLQESKSDENGVSGKSGSRWGDNKARYTKVKVERDTNKNQIKIHLKVKTDTDMEKPNYGFLVKNFADQIILGGSTLVNEIETENQKSGSTIDLCWIVPDIFNEGAYQIDVALSYNQGVTADWWQEAATFRINRNKNTPYLINPPVKLEIST